MASYADAAAGWEIYRQADYGLTLREINAALTRRGYGPVSPRTFRHYGKLQRYGYSRYVPINQLDVKTLRDPFLDQTSRSREHPVQTASPVQLRVLDNDRIATFDGVAIELSTSEAVLRLEGEAMADFWSRLATTSPYGEVVFRATGEVRGGNLERLSLDVEGKLGTVRVTFVDSIDLRPLVESPAPDHQMVLRLVIGTRENQPSLQTAARHLYWLSQAAESARAAVSEITSKALDGNRGDLNQAVVRELRIGSIEVVIGLGFSTGAMLYAAFRGALSLRRAFWSSEREKQEALRLRWHNNREGVQRNLDPASLTTKITSLLRRDRKVSDEEGLDLETSERIVQKQLLPAVNEIIELADGDVELEVLQEPEQHRGLIETLGEIDSLPSQEQ